MDLRSGKVFFVELHIYYHPYDIWDPHVARIKKKKCLLLPPHAIDVPRLPHRQAATEPARGGEGRGLGGERGHGCRQARELGAVLHGPADIRHGPARARGSRRAPVATLELRRPHR
jgi:hypothetical protein